MDPTGKRLIDPFGRHITYLRVSVTDRCNLRCHYCNPCRDIQLIPRESILSLEEIETFVGRAVALGIRKVRLTGGEPLMRRNILFLVEKLGEMDGIQDFAMTTNGTLLNHFARPLRKAGLMRINISLDTLDPMKYRTLTDGGDIRLVLDGIEAARQAGLNPIKINCVLNPGINDRDTEEISSFCRKNDLHPQFIEVMNLGEVKQSVRRSIHSTRPPDCDTCDKLRLTCDGRLYTCLFSNRWIQVQEAGSYDEAITKAVALKAESGRHFPLGTMAQIGG